MSNTSITSIPGGPSTAGGTGDAPEDLTDYAIDAIAVVCLHALASSEEEALRKILAVQGATLDFAIPSESVTATELSVRHVSAVPYAHSPEGKDLPVAFTRPPRAARLAKLADECEASAAAFRAAADAPGGHDAEYEAATDLVDAAEVLVSEIRGLLNDVDDDIL